MPAASVIIGPGSGGVGSSSVTINATGNFTAGGSTNIPLPTATNANSPLITSYQNLASGANTITISANASSFMLIPPTGNTQTLTLKGLTADTGIPLSKIAPFVLQFDTVPPASLVITAGGIVTGVQIIQY